MSLNNPFSAEPKDLPEGDFITPDHKATDDTPLTSLNPDDQPKPPRRGRPPKPEAKPLLERLVPDKVPNRKGQFIEPMQQFYGTIAIALMPFKPELGAVIMQQATPCAEAWDKLAHENEAVRKALKSFMTVSTVGMLVTAHAPIAAVAIAPLIEKRLGKDVAEEAERIANAGE